MKRATFLFLLLSLSAHAQQRDLVDVSSATIVTVPGDTVEVGPGCYLSEKACVAVGKAVAADSAEDKALRDAVPTTPVVAVVGVGGVLVGLVLGFLLASARK